MTRIIIANRCVVILALSTLLASCVTSEGAQLSRSGVQDAGEELLSVLKSGELSQLRGHLVDNSNLDTEEMLGGDTLSYFYDGEWIRDYIEGGRSIMEIIAVGEITILEAPQADSSTILVFVPEEYVESAQESDFYNERWMREYFACRFSEIDGRWKMVENVCFAESGGPFPEDHGF